MIEQSIASAMLLVGYALLQISYLPQYYNLYKSKKSDQVSRTWVGQVFIATLLMEPLMLWYSPIEIAIGNTVGIIASGMLLIQVQYYR